MAGKSDAFEQALLELIFNNIDIANVGDAAGVQGPTSEGNLYVALLTSDLTDAGALSSAETSYTNYARVAVPRNNSGSGWVVTGNSVSPQVDIDFPECGSTPGAALTHFAVTTAVSGDSLVLYHGTLSPNISMAQGVIPRVKNTSIITED